MHRLAFALLFATACTRTDLGQPADCGNGQRVVVNYNEICVYAAEAEVECPEALPNLTAYGGALFCTREAEPAVPLLSAALLATRDGGAEDALPDAATDATLFDAARPDAQADIAF